MIRNFLVGCAVCSVLLPASAAHAAESVKSLLLSALNAPDGKARGTLEGQEVDYIHTKTGATDPVLGEVITVKRFEHEPGCARLNLKLIQPNMPTKSGQRAEYFLRYELNLCKDGTPPSEGVNMGPNTVVETAP